MDDKLNPKHRRVIDEILREWAALVATLNPVQLEVLNEKRILLNGSPSVHKPFSNLRGVPSTGDPFPKMAPDVAQRLFKLDPTPDSRWTPLIFHAAGGGLKALEHSQRQLNNFKNVYLKEGGTEEAFEASLAGVKRRMFSAHENDHSMTAACFGYYTDWPGRGGIYAEVESAFQAYLPMLPKLEQMNAEIAANPDTEEKPVPTTPEDLLEKETATTGVPSLMMKAVKEAKHYFQAKALQTEVKLSPWKEQLTVYDDDYLTLVIPTTYLAAVEYGFDDLEISSREGLEQTARTRATRNPWNQYVDSDTVLGFINFNVPTPSFMVPTGFSLRRRRLDQVALKYDGQKVLVILPGGRELPFKDFAALFKKKESHLYNPAQQAITDLNPEIRDRQPVKPPRWDPKGEDVKNTLLALQAAAKEFKEAASRFDRSQLQPAFD